MAITQLQPFNLDSTKSYTFGNVTAVGNVTASNANLGNAVTANYFISNGNVLSTNALSAGTSNVVIVSSGGNVTVGVGGTGNVVVVAATGQYVTGVLSASGNITGDNILTAGLLSATGNGTFGNLTTSGLISAAGNVTGGNILTSGLFSVSGNITGGNLLINNDATITGNLVVNGNTTFINSNVVTTNDKSITLANNQSTAANVDGAGIDIGSTNIAYWRFNNATTSWQSNVGLTPAANATLNLGGASNFWGNGYINALNAVIVSATGNVSGGNFVTNGLTSTNNFSITGNITGNLLPSANGTYNLGSPDQQWKSLYLTGNTIYIGDQAFSSNATAIATSNDFAAANLNAVSFVTGSTVSASGNIIGGNVVTSGLASVAGNVFGGNLLTAGILSVAGNVSGGNLLTSGVLSVAGNATIAGDLSVSGNIIGVLQDHGSDSNNWDTITKMGTYTVNRVSWAGTIGTPLDSQVFVGLLEVLNSSDVAISQVFYPGTIETGNVKIQWNRANWSNVWSPWIKIINNDQIVSGGEF